MIIESSLEETKKFFDLRELQPPPKKLSQCHSSSGQTSSGFFSSSSATSVSGSPTKSAGNSNGEEILCEFCDEKMILELKSDFDSDNEDDNDGN